MGFVEDLVDGSDEVLALVFIVEVLVDGSEGLIEDVVDSGAAAANCLSDGSGAGAAQRAEANGAKASKTPELINLMMNEMGSASKKRLKNKV